jgi:hypothetical protein
MSEHTEANETICREMFDLVLKGIECMGNGELEYKILAHHIGNAARDLRDIAQMAQSAQMAMRN